MSTKFLIFVITRCNYKSHYFCNSATMNIFVNIVKLVLKVLWESVNLFSLIVMSIFGLISEILFCIIYLPCFPPLPPPSVYSVKKNCWFGGYMFYCLPLKFYVNTFHTLYFFVSILLLNRAKNFRMPCIPSLLFLFKIVLQFLIPPYF